MKKQIMILLVACQLFGGAVFCMDQKKPIIREKHEENSYFGDDRFERQSVFKNERFEYNLPCCVCGEEIKGNFFCGFVYV